QATPVVKKPKPTPAPKPKEEKPVAEQPAPHPVTDHTEEGDAPPVIENIQAERLTGPKILGKIQLPVDSDTRPKPAAPQGAGNMHDEKRKRKRIPIDKKGENISRPQVGGQQG